MPTDDYNRLRHWVTESTRTAKMAGDTETIEHHVQQLLNAQEPITDSKTVYRVHTPNSKTIVPRSWFATSSSVKRVLRQHHSEGTDCCLFKIHVESGIQVLDVDAALETSGKRPTGYKEEEILVNGGGVFYKTKTGSEKGFNDLGEKELTDDRGKSHSIRIFETWYKPKTTASAKRAKTAADMFAKIDPIEYEFIETLKNLSPMKPYLYNSKKETVSPSEWPKLFDLVTAAKTRRSSNRHRKTRKSRK